MDYFVNYKLLRDSQRQSLKHPYSKFITFFYSPNDQMIVQVFFSSLNVHEATFSKHPPQKYIICHRNKKKNMHKTLLPIYAL